MTIFNYKARDKTGKEILGNIDAPDETIVIRSLRQLDYSIISIEKEPQLKQKTEAFLARIKGVSPSELLFFVRQLATLLKSGVPLTTAVLSIKEQTKNKLMQKTLGQISKNIKEGGSLSDSLADCPKVFSPYFVSMVRVGETGGILENILDRLIQLLTQELEIRSRIKSAMTYPVILVIAAVVIVTFIMARIVPKFIPIFETYEAQLPLPTQILFTLSSVIGKLWYVPLILFVGLCLWFRRYLKSERARYNFNIFLFKIPLFGPLYLKVTIAQFSRTLAALIRSGVPLLDALGVTQKTVSNVPIKNIIQNVSSAISKGESLSEPFKEASIFPTMVIQMISVGEKSGKLDQVLFDVANFYDQEIDYTIRNMTAVLEPALLLIMGSMVAFIALSVLLPIFNLVKVLRH